MVISISTSIIYSDIQGMTERYSWSKLKTITVEDTLPLIPLKILFLALNMLTPCFCYFLKQFWTTSSLGVLLHGCNNQFKTFTFHVHFVFGDEPEVPIWWIITQTHDNAFRSLFGWHLAAICMIFLTTHCENTHEREFPEWLQKVG